MRRRYGCRSARVRSERRLRHAPSPLGAARAEQEGCAAACQKPSSIARPKTCKPSARISSESRFVRHRTHGYACAVHSSKPAVCFRGRAANFVCRAREWEGLPYSASVTAFPTGCSMCSGGKAGAYYVNIGFGAKQGVERYATVSSTARAGPRGQFDSSPCLAGARCRDCRQGGSAHGPWQVRDRVSEDAVTEPSPCPGIAGPRKRPGLRAIMPASIRGTLLSAS